MELSKLPIKAGKRSRVIDPQEICKGLTLRGTVENLWEPQPKALNDLLAKTNALKPDTEAKLTETAQLRADCQRSMLKHFFEVSRTMPLEQGRRYLKWVQEKTFLPRYVMAEGY